MTVQCFCRGVAREGWSNGARPSAVMNINVLPETASMYVIAHIERQARNPSLHTLAKLAVALHLSLEELLSAPQPRP